MLNGIHVVGQRSRPRSKAPQERPLWFPIPRLNVMAHRTSLEVGVRRDDLRAGESQPFGYRLSVEGSASMSYSRLRKSGSSNRPGQLMGRPTNSSANARQVISVIDTPQEYATGIAYLQRTSEHSFSPAPLGLAAR